MRRPTARRLRRAVGLCLLALVLPFSAALAAAGKVTLSLELPGNTAARGGMTPLDIFALIEPGWHINAHTPTEAYLIATELTLALPPGITAEPLAYPPPDRKTFTFAQGKELRVYEGKLGLATALHVPAGFPEARVPVAATLRYQACNDAVCLPPATATAQLLVPVTAAVAPAAPASAVPAARASVDRWLDERGLLFTLVAVALLGVGLNLTPCVYPLISVTVAYFGGHGQARTGRAALRAVVYVLGMALSFSALGVAAAASGGLFGAALQKPAVIVFIAAVLVALSLSSFGLYQLRAPTALMRWAGGATSGVAGAAFMGLTMGIVAAPCIGPFVLALLVAVGARQDLLLGFLLFFALAVGMGAPYIALAVAVGSIKQLPRSGEWLVWIERLFGFVLLGMAAYFIAPVLPHPWREVVLPALIAIAGIYLGFLDRSGHTLRAFGPVKQATGVAALALALWIGWPQTADSAIEWQNLTPATVTVARDAGRPTVIDFRADWCIPCIEMARTTFADARVTRAALHFHMVKADVTEETAENRRLLEQFDVRGVPTVLVLDASGKEVQRLVGYTSASELLEAMQRAG